MKRILRHIPLMVLVAATTWLAAATVRDYLQPPPASVMQPLGPHRNPLKELRKDTYTSKCNPDRFDGRCLYDVTWQAQDQIEMYLGDSKQRAEFAKWRHKFDDTHDLDCPEATKENGFACPSADRVIEQMIYSISQEFDYYFDVATTRQVQQLEHSDVEGIGVQLVLKDAIGLVRTFPPGTTEEQGRKLLKVSPGHELVIVSDPEEDSPSFNVLKKGDAIVAVQEFGDTGKPLELEGMTKDEAVGHIRGKTGTKVQVTFDRPAGDGPPARQTVTIARAHIDRHVVHMAVIEGKAVLIKIDDYEADTFPADFDRIIAKANALKLPIIFNERGNHGGRIGSGQRLLQRVMEQGVELETFGREFDSDVFYDEQIIITRDARVVLTREVNGSNPAIMPKLLERLPLLVDPNTPIAVLIDGESASTSEIVAGALQSAHRARLYGMPSFRKDEGQEEVPLPYNRRAHIPTYFFRPGGKPIQQLVPDVQIDRTKEDIEAGRDPQLDAAVAGVTAEAAEVAHQAELAKARTEEREKYRKMFICQRNKAAELPPGQPVTEEIVKSCEAN